MARGVKYTPEEVNAKIELAKELAKQYPNPHQFELKHPNLWHFIRSKKMVNDVFPNKKNYNFRGYWTVDTVTKEAEKYKTRSEFQNKNQTAYNKAVTLGILDQLFPETYVTKYNLKKSLELGKKYKTHGEFRINYPTAYNVVKDAGLLKSLFPNYHGRGRYPYSKYGEWSSKSTDELIQIAKDTIKSGKTISKDLYPVYDNLRKRGIDTKELTKKSEDDIIQNIKKNFDIPYDLSVRNPNLYKVLLDIPNGIVRAFGDRYNIPNYDFSKKKQGNPNSEIPNDVFIKKQKDMDKLDDDRRYKRGVMFTPVTENKS
jgi:hypothetical protein